MATTTNYSWTTPDDTALVKDGASAIRTLGSSIDTTTKALNPSTTLGDIEYRSSTANTNTRLALGTAGQVLTVNSGATAPEWAAPVAGGMTSLATGTLSGTVVSLTGISGSYIDLYLVISNPYLISTASLLSYRFNGQTAGYNSTGLSTSNGTVLNTTGGASMFPSISKNLPTSTNSHSSTVYIRNYTSTSRKTILMTYDVGSSNESITSIGNLSSAGASAITSIDIRTELGTPSFGGGTYTLYGVK
jgi:hypothetical protein